MSDLSPGALATRRWRDRNRVTYNASRAEQRAAVRKEIARLKEADPCVDCGGYFPAVCMDYDHVGKKSSNVSRLVSDARNLSRVLAEVALCDLVCANCHRLRTFTRNASERTAS